MKIIKPLAGGFIIGEIFPKFRIGLLRDQRNYSRSLGKCKYFEISDSRHLCRSLDFLRSHQYIHPGFATPQEGKNTNRKLVFSTHRGYVISLDCETFPLVEGDQGGVVFSHLSPILLSFNIFIPTLYEIYFLLSDLNLCFF